DPIDPASSDASAADADSSTPGEDATDGETIISLGADAGENITVRGGETVGLSGSATGHSGSSPVSFAWRKLAGADVALNDPRSATPTFVAPEPMQVSQFLIWGLTVTVDEMSAVDTVEVEVLPLTESDAYGVHVEFMSGPEGTTAPGSYEVSWRFLDGTPRSNVYLSRDCCECQNINSAILTPDAGGIYATSVEIPNDRTVWYFVRYTRGGTEYTSRSIHVNTSSGNPAAPEPIVIWWHPWHFDLEILETVLASGVVTHVMIDGGDRCGAYYEEAVVHEAIAMCQANGVKTIWSLNLWNSFTELPTLDDTVDPSYYVAAMEEINAEANLIGADYSAMDCETYSGVPFDAVFEEALPQEHFDAMSAAIEQAARQVRVDFIYPAGTPFAPLYVNNTYRPLGRIRIAASTYYDAPYKICRLDYPFEVFGAFVKPFTERPDHAWNPYFLPYDIVSRRYYWSQASGASGAVNGLWLYSGVEEDEARISADMLYQYFSSP
ncbi:MAG: hypothetical protein KJ749_10125, partial [Planctomycetes bacterium]|nr:hypothetical protein [Planctomycetota bacterium]